MLLPLVKWVFPWRWTLPSFGAENLSSRQAYDSDLHIPKYFIYELIKISFLFLNSTFRNIDCFRFFPAYECWELSQGFPVESLRFVFISSYLVTSFQELDHVVEELEKIAVVNLLQHRSIISLIGNVQRSSLILEKVLTLFESLKLFLSLKYRHWIVLLSMTWRDKNSCIAATSKVPMNISFIYSVLRKLTYAIVFSICIGTLCY